MYAEGFPSHRDSLRQIGFGILCIRSSRRDHCMVGLMSLDPSLPSHNDLKVTVFRSDRCQSVTTHESDSCERLSPDFIAALNIVAKVGPRGHEKT